MKASRGISLWALKNMVSLPTEAFVSISYEYYTGKN